MFRKAGSKQRVIAHVDMDCFYVQVEAGLDPSLRGVPCAVVQYNPFGELKSYHHTENRKNISQSGGIIAVNYEARALGVKRHTRGHEASKTCPSIQLVQVPTTHGKADITVYRKAGEEVVRVLSSLFSCPVEKASIDEVYLDLTDECHRRLRDDDYLSRTVPLAAGSAVLLSSGTLSGKSAGDNGCVAEDIGGSAGWMAAGLSEDDQLLVCGAAAAQELRAEVLKQLGYTCSAGVAHNKMLAKIASSSHKPNKQAIIPSESVAFMLNALPIEKIPGYGGKLGETVKTAMGINTVGELQCDPDGLAKLVARFGAGQGQDIWRTLSGIDDNIVKARSAQSIISCGKQFPEKLALSGVAAWKPAGDVEVWVHNLCSELTERLTDDQGMHNRAPKLFGVSAQFKLLKIAGGGEAKGMSESCPMPGTPAQMEAAAGTMLRNLLGTFIDGVAPGLSACFGSGNDESAIKLSVDTVSISSLFVKASSFCTIPEEKERITRFFNSGPGCAVQPNFDSLSTTSTRELSDATGSQLPPDIKSYFMNRNCNGRDEKSPLSPDDSPSKRRKVTNDDAQAVAEHHGAYDQSNVDLDVLAALPDELRHEILNEMCTVAERKLHPAVQSPGKSVPRKQKSGMRQEQGSSKASCSSSSSSRIKSYFIKKNNSES